MPQSVGAIGGPWAQFCWGFRGSWDQKSGPWPGLIERVQEHQDTDLPKAAGEVLSGEFSPKAALTHHLREFEGGIIELWPHSLEGKDCFEHYNLQSSKRHYCFIGKKPCRRTGLQASNIRRYLWSKKNGPYGKEFPVSEAPTPDGTSGYSNLTGSRQRDVGRWTNVGGPIPVVCRPIYSSSAVPISIINTEGIVKRIRQIYDSPPDPDAEGSYELDGEEVEVIPKPYHSKHPQKFPTNSCCHSKLPSSHARPALNPATRPTPIQQPRNSPIITSQQLQPVASSSRRRDGLSPLPFPAAEVFQRRDCWPIQATREDPNAASENQETVARLFRRVVRHSREVIMYANDRNIPDTASEKIAAKFAWYEDELINDFQRTFDDLDRDH
ncbi:hypothetical protein O181_094615 [Austropuccinia psidii MF-1]|uniref:Uncharacterized protein n=1 Tax=Austropuccinia psidii MF-1 TaxID=1389203 RepID=A0A9Q3PB88_9BASI|nr:hypothetical protein [Austropuccinia psidii MF-1]